ncbi:DUF3782 domain-containing protein [Thermochromatium tepidum]|uniref:DUF3782 domain-containing protein n=1 Tax=Thermochromatium tepidum ATCC 43061 TaxID=316276 RepID=A0A6I6EKB5_THETI|nr:DUF3782 domain-containing protein [Thermochromatium tepidum]QGU33537.1 DUF3782 domain-containing protein [Thermochromatium tepidum ATCC 43061]
MSTTAAEMSWDEIKALVAELAIQSKDTDRKFQETDRKFQETDRKFQETEAQMRETRRLVERISRDLGRLGNRLGEFVEEMVEPAVVALFQARGLKVHRTMQDLTCRDDDGRLLAQVDLAVIDSDTLIAVECKSHLSVDDVNEHLERLAHFKTYWPEYGGYKLLAAVAAMVVPEEVAAYAYRKGLFVLAPSGETMRLLNDEAFQPKAW